MAEIDRITVKTSVMSSLYFTYKHRCKAIASRILSCSTGVNQVQKHYTISAWLIITLLRHPTSGFVQVSVFAILLSWYFYRMVRFINVRYIHFFMYMKGEDNQQ